MISDQVARLGQNPNQQYYRSWGRSPTFEQPTAFNNLSDQYALHAQKQAQLAQSYSIVNNGRPMPAPMIMVSPEMLKSRQYQIAQETSGMDDARFSTQEAKNIKNQLFTGLQKFSRFYSALHVPPEVIAADHGPSVFTHTSNSVPTGDSILTDGSTPMMVRSTEQLEFSDQGLPMDKFVRTYKQQPAEQPGGLVTSKANLNPRFTTF